LDTEKNPTLYCLKFSHHNDSSENDHSHDGVERGLMTTIFFSFVCFEIPRCLPLVSDVHSLVPGGEKRATWKLPMYDEDEDGGKEGFLLVRI
jgi:hypothetical protein